MIPTESLRSTIDATTPPRCGPETPVSNCRKRHGVAGKNLFQQRTEGADLLDRAQRRVHLQLHRLAAHPVPRRDLPPPVRLHGPEGCAALDADQCRRVLQTRRFGRFLPTDRLAALDGQRHHRLRFPTDPLFPRRGALPLGPPCALVPRRLRIGLLRARSKSPSPP